MSDTESRRDACIPVALFVYDRLDTLPRVISSVLSCNQASRTELYVFSDGPKAGNANAVEKVRSYIRTIDGFSSITIVESRHNKGLAQSIRDGVSNVLHQNDAVIVLEDDVVVGRSFLRYMNDALNFYKDVSEVMHVSAYMDPVELGDGKAHTFFYPVASCWGWGTWKRAWKYYNDDSHQLYTELVERKLLYDFTLGGCDLFRSQLLDNVAGIKSTWAINWMASIYLNRGLCLHPYRSLTANLGIGAGATNTHKLQPCYVNQRPYEGEVSVERIEYRNSEEVMGRMRDFYRFNGQSSWWSRWYTVCGKSAKRLVRDVRRWARLG